MLYKFAPFASSKVWKFQDPDTETVLQASSKAELIQRIVTYRAQNELDQIENLDLVLDNYLCKLPENVGACVPVQQIKRGLLEYIQGGVQLLRNVLYKSFVSQEEADKRATICIGCPHNVFPDKGPFIKWSDDIAEASTEGRKAAEHDKLGNCEICSCPLRAKVWIGEKFSLPVTQYDALPDFCWQKILLKSEMDVKRKGK